jgi:hypothetical protein
MEACMIDFTSIEQARTAFRQLYNQVQAILKWDFKGSQLKNIGNGVAEGDAVNVGQLNAAVKNTGTPTVPPAQQSTFFNTLTVGTLTIISKIIPQITDTVILGDAINWFQRMYLKELVCYNSTASQPAKFDVNQILTSGAIDLATAEVTGTLPENKGGTGTTTAGINGALTLTPSTATLSLSVGTTTLQYKDHAGVNQTLDVVTSVSLNNAGSYLTSVTLTTNSFTKGKRTT